MGDKPRPARFAKDQRHGRQTPSRGAGRRSRVCGATCNGDVLYATADQGSDPRRNHVFVAGGMGITPFRSMLTEADHAGQKLKVQLLCGNRDDGIAIKGELDGFAARNENLKIDYSVHPESGKHARGRVMPARFVCQLFY